MRDWPLGRQVLAGGLVLLLPSLVVALSVGWLWEALSWWNVNDALLAWRWSVGWILGVMALSVVVDLAAGRGGPPRMTPS